MPTAGRASEPHHPIDKHEYRVADRCLVSEVGRHEHGRRAPPLGEDVAQAEPLVGIEAGGGLVQQQQRGRPKQCLGQSEASPHPARQPFDAIVSSVAQPDGVENLEHRPPSSAVVAMTLQHGEIVDGIESRRAGDQAVVLWEIAEATANLGPFVLAAATNPMAPRATIQEPSGVVAVHEHKQSPTLSPT